MEAPAAPPPPTTSCPNCGYAVVAWLPAICSECGFEVVHRDPRWRDRPLSWTKRILFLGWPVIGLAAAVPLADARGGLGTIASSIAILCFLAGFINPTVMLFPVSLRPPLFISNEPPERAARRCRLTVALTIALGLLIPVLVFGSCLLSVAISRLPPGPSAREQSN